MTLRIGVLISGRGSNLAALIKACSIRNYPAKIAIVISNRPAALGLKLAQSANVATKTIDEGGFPDRFTFEKAITKALEDAKVDLVCLAGFMRMLTNDFVDHWFNRLINIHPSLLPAFKGLNVHQRVIQSGVRFSGCTVHYVRPDMDSGPIILQSVIPVLIGDKPQDLATRVLKTEHRCLPLAVRWIAEGRLHIVNNIVMIRGATDLKTSLIYPEFTG